MKKCAVCGKEYPAEVVRCSMDGELLATDEPQPLPVSLPSQANATPSGAWTDRKTRIFEVVLVCVVAFGGSILLSAYRLYTMRPVDSIASVGALNWANTLLHDGAGLGLLWYVLMRRSRTFSDLGLSWVKSDFGYSILIYIVGCVAFFGVYGAIALTGLTSAGASTSIGRVTHHLFGAGIGFATMVVQFLNPFFEELIVRAYVMTELKQLTNSVWKPIVVSTFLQMSYHFYQGAPMAFSSGAMFLVFSIYYAKTNRIAPIILAHLYGDVGATLLYALRQHSGAGSHN